MSRRLARCALALAALAMALGACGEGSEPPPPRSFFGITPQQPPSEADARRMREAGIGTVRWSIGWNAVQPEPEGEYDWEAIDPVVAVLAKHRLAILANLGGTPEWAGEPTELPVETEAQREGWRAFVRAAVERYGPGGDFWLEHRPGSAEPLPADPIREWQVWNEANFYYFAEPVSPERYAALVEETHDVLSAADPKARLILSGLFANPPEEPPRGMPASRFLSRLYEDGLKGDFDGIALHPYARDTERLEEFAGDFREVAVDNGDAGVGLYLTELGWGSQSESEDSFEKGPEGQAEELTDAYDYLISERRDLNLKAVYWFSWKDLAGSCDFCDSVGLFEEGEGFEPKPAWDAFLEVTGGRAPR
jgi:hypothetical protein